VVKPIKQLISPRMMEKAKKSDIYETLKHSKNYFFADIAIKAVGVISVPIFTRLLRCLCRNFPHYLILEFTCCCG